MRSLPLVVASLLAALVFAGGALPATASAAVPCWKSVIADWSSDGSIDGSYPSACYRQAMQNAPADLRIYSTLEDDLQSALQQRSSRQLAGVHATVATLDSSPGASSLAFLVALVAGLAVLLAACAVAAAFVRRHAAR